MNGRNIKLVLAAFLLCLSFATISVQAEPYETILNNGNSQNRLDIAFVGDGYTQGELQKYKNDAQSMIQGFFAEQPFLEYQRYFNVHRIDVTSAQSGADHPERSFFVDTAFDANYNCSGIQRLICVNYSKVNNVAVNTLSPTQRDLVFVIVNDSEYGGSGGPIAVASTNAQAVELILHEEGHSLGLLTDEYGGPPPPLCNGPMEPAAANATKETQRALIKWNLWIDPNTPLPTNTSNPGVPGAYQGAAYCDTGLYRPTFLSKMRAVGFPFEQINSEQLVKRIHNYVSPLDSRLPDSSNLTVARGQIQNFSVSTPAPLSHNLTVLWYVDGLQQASGPAFNFDSNNLSVGAHTVSAAVNDASPFVRSDPNQLLNAAASWDVNVVAPSPVQLDAASYSKNESDMQVNVTVNRGGDTSAAGSVDYATSDGTASDRSDYEAALGTLNFSAGETSKTITVFIVNDSFGESPETFNITLSAPVGCTIGSPAATAVTINSDEAVDGPNPVKDASFNTAFFVRQHYIDFFNREPDPGGLAFWKNQIDECETRPPAERQACREIRRINVSAAFFKSIEFQETGYLVERLYRVAYDSATGTSTLGGTHQLSVPIVRLNEFLADTQQIGRGVIIGQPGDTVILENNKQALIAEFVLRSRFTTAYPSSMTPAQFVDALNANAEGALSQTERDQLVSDLTSGAKTRAQVLRAVAEDADLFAAENNRAFVLAQFLGYLRRNPNDSPEAGLDYTGYDFWLGKLILFNGNFVNAEMVKAFIVSGEYQQRFGP